MVNELKANGGHDYTATLRAELVPDSSVFQTLIPPRINTFDATDTLGTAELSISYNNAQTAGAALSTDINVLLDSNISFLMNASTFELEIIYVFLMCSLGAHRNPPV